MNAILTLTALFALSLAAARLLRWRAPAMAAQVCFGMACLALILPVAEWAFPGWRQPQLITLPVNSSGAGRAVAEIASGSVPTLPTAMPVVRADAIVDGGAIGIASMAWTAWLLGALVFLSRWLSQMHAVRCEVRNAQRDPTLERKFSLLSRRPLQIRFSTGANGAYLWHGREAIVVLPEHYRRFPAARLRLVVLHELAHHARGDNRRLAALRLCRLMWWFHPLAWWLERVGRDCAELAADDEVLQRQVSAEDYAAVLARLARPRVVSGPVVALAGLGLRARLERLLKPPRPAPRLLLSLGAIGLVATGASLASVDLRFVHAAGDDWVWSMRTGLTPHRFEDLPDGRLQLATFYDGADTGGATLAIELGNASGMTRWYQLPALIKFDRGMRRVELELAPGIRPSGRLRVNGMEPDGVVDGVAIGMAWRESDTTPIFRRTRASRDGDVPRTVCSWPLALTSERMLDDGRRIEHWEMDTLQRLLCGAELVENGLVAI